MISHAKLCHFPCSLKRRPSQRRGLLGVHPVAKAVREHGAKLALVPDAVEFAPNSMASFTLLFHEAARASKPQVGGFLKITFSFQGLDLSQGVEAQVLES